jgi:hypothetical protein
MVRDMRPLRSACDDPRDPERPLGITLVLGMRKKSDVDHAFAQVEAIGRSQAMIEFDLYGTIIKANRNFLAVSLSET